MSLYQRFRKKVILVLIIFVLTSSCKPNTSIPLFSIKELEPVVLEKNGNEIFQYWELGNDPFLWSYNIGEVTGINLYRDSLQSELGKEKLEKAIRKEAGQSEDSDTNIEAGDGDQKNAALVHSGSLGTIREVNFLEAQLLDYQISKYPLLGHPTEFQAFILWQDSLSRFRVYFAGSDTPWPPKPTVILKEIEKDLVNGWVLKYHLHNHYEPKSNNYIGIMAPSLADAQFFKMLSENFKLENALITNGFNTVEIKSEEFWKFESH